MSLADEMGLDTGSSTDEEKEGGEEGSGTGGGGNDPPSRRRTRVSKGDDNGDVPPGKRANRNEGPDMLEAPGGAPGDGDTADSDGADGGNAAAPADVEMPQAQETSGSSSSGEASSESNSKEEPPKEPSWPPDGTIAWETSWGEWEPGKNKNTSSEGILPASLETTIKLLKSENGLMLLQRAIRTNLRYKAQRYAKIREELDGLIVLEEKQAESSQKYFQQQSKAHHTDNWNIYETFSENLRALRVAYERASTIEQSAVKQYGELRLEVFATANRTTALLQNGKLTARRKLLVEQMEGLECFRAHEDVISAVAGVVKGFLLTPEVVQKNFLNWIFVGKAGTGKTTIARDIAKIFATAGIFVYDSVLESGRGNFVASFVGQSTSKTNMRLAMGLEKVHFVDEAYAIAGQPNKEGKFDDYGQEAISTIVDFCTKYKGLYCLMFAGYKTEMQKQFLDVNSGLDRRIPYKFELIDYKVDELVGIFKRTLLSEQGYKVTGCKEGATDAALRWYTYGAWTFLKRYLKQCENWANLGKPAPATDPPEQAQAQEQKASRWELSQLIAAQAGSMTNLAEMAVLDVASRKDPKKLAEAECLMDQQKVEATAGGVYDMVQLIRDMYERILFGLEGEKLQTVLDQYTKEANTILDAMAENKTEKWEKINRDTNLVRFSNYENCEEQNKNEGKLEYTESERDKKNAAYKLITNDDDSKGGGRGGSCVSGLFKGVPKEHTAQNLQQCADLSLDDKVLWHLYIAWQLYTEKYKPYKGQKSTDDWINSSFTYVSGTRCQKLTRLGAKGLQRNKDAVLNTLMETFDTAYLREKHADWPRDPKKMPDPKELEDPQLSKDGRVHRMCKKEGDRVLKLVLRSGNSTNDNRDLSVRERRQKFLNMVVWIYYPTKAPMQRKFAVAVESTLVDKCSIFSPAFPNDDTTSVDETFKPGHVETYGADMPDDTRDAKAAVEVELRKAMDYMFKLVTTVSEKANREADAQPSCSADGDDDEEAGAGANTHWERGMSQPYLAEEALKRGLTCTNGKKTTRKTKKEILVALLTKDDKRLEYMEKTVDELRQLATRNGITPSGGKQLNDLSQEQLAELLAQKSIPIIIECEPGPSGSADP